MGRSNLGCERNHHVWQGDQVTVRRRPEVVRVVLHPMRGRLPAHRLRWMAAMVGLTLITTTGCSIATQAGSAFIVDGQSVSDASVQHDSAVFAQENVTTALTDIETASFNRAQITFAVRHVLIARALSAKGLVISDAELAAAKAQVDAPGSTANLPVQVGVPKAEEPDVLHDVVALDELVKALPAAGTPVQNVSVTAEGVPATTRGEAVTLRSHFIADPASMNAAVAAAGTNGVAKKVYQLVQTPVAGAAGLYQPSSGGVVIVPGSTGYLVLRTSGRTVTTTNLTQAAFSSLSGLSAAFDVGALLLAPYQGAAGISVNPRYGVWDPATLQVVPGNDGL